MLEFFSKKGKKQQPQKAEGAEEAKKSKAASPSSSPSLPTIINPEAEVGTPVLNADDEKFLERIVSPDESVQDEDDDGPPPPLPPRVKTPVIDWDSDAESAKSKEIGKSKNKGKEIEKPGGKKGDDKKAKRFSIFNISMKKKPAVNNPELHPAHLDVPHGEEMREEAEISQVLDDLNLSAKNNKAFSLSAESTELVRKFTVVLKDLVNGVPTAYGDLVALIEDRDGVLNRTYEKLPKSLKKIVTQLPNKLTGSLAPELLAVAAEAQGLSKGEGSKAGIKSAAKRLLHPKNLQELVTKPGAIVGLLKGIMNALKTRFPAFMGTNVLWSIAIFLLLFVLWYCHKRGRETRLEREGAEAGAPIDGSSRVEELPDDPQLPAAGGPASPFNGNVNLPPPPVGVHAGKASPSASSRK